MNISERIAGSQATVQNSRTESSRNAMSSNATAIDRNCWPAPFGKPKETEALLLAHWE